MGNKFMPIPLFVILFISCTSLNNSKKEIKEQDKFIEMVSQRIDSIKSCVSLNPIQSEKNKTRKIYYNKQFFNLISKYADSIQIFNNWSGIIEDFEYTKGKESSHIYLTIRINYQGEKFISQNDILLLSIYSVDNKEKAKDIVFNNMAKINKNSKIYVTGFINRSMNGYISIGENFNEFNFSILNISTSPINDSISKDAKVAIKRKFEEMKIFGRGVLNRKSEKEIKKECAFLKNDSIINTLATSDKSLVKKIEKLYITNIAREYVNR